MRRAMALAALGSWGAALAVSALGWTASLSALCLTAPEGESLDVAVLKAAVVLITWFGAVMVAPVLLLTAAAWRLLSPRSA